MGSAVVMVFEGGLRAETHDGPIRAGGMLYRAMTSVAQVAVVVDHTRVDLAQHWLDINGMKDHAWLISPRPEDSEDVVKRRLDQLARLRSQGASVELVIEPDPSIAAALQADGIATALFLHPRYARPEFRPDYQYRDRPWDEVLKEIERQAILSGLDPEGRRPELI